MSTVIPELVLGIPAITALGLAMPHYTKQSFLTSAWSGTFQPFQKRRCLQFLQAEKSDGKGLGGSARANK